MQSPLLKLPVAVPGTPKMLGSTKRETRETRQSHRVGQAKAVAIFHAGDGILCKKCHYVLIAFDLCGQLCSCTQGLGW
jgi:hypothetical protein